MATLPPIQTLFELLPDNNSGLIQPVDLRNVVEVLYDGVLSNITDLSRYLPLSGGTMEGPLTLQADPQLPLQAATKRYADNIFSRENFLKADGSITMVTGYEPSDPFSIATKQFVENNGLPIGGTANQILTKQSATNQDADWQDAPPSGQEWSIGTDSQTINAGQAKYVTTAGDTLFLPNTDKLISLIVTDGSGQASTANPIKIQCDGTPNTFDDGSTLFELDVAGASVEFALLANVWRLVNFGRILPEQTTLSNVAFLDQPNVFTKANTFDSITMDASYTPSNDQDIAILKTVTTEVANAINGLPDIPNITISTQDPVGGSDGDIWFKVD